jgi:hypothetical protein
MQCVSTELWRTELAGRAVVASSAATASTAVVHTELKGTCTTAAHVIERTDSLRLLNTTPDAIINLGSSPSCTAAVFALELLLLALL